MRWTKAKILPSPREDLYITLASWTEDTSAVTINVKINPMVSWIWVGGSVLVIGTVIAMWPDKREREYRRRLAGGMAEPRSRQVLGTQ